MLTPFVPSLSSHSRSSQSMETQLATISFKEKAAMAFNLNTPNRCTTQPSSRAHIIEAQVHG